MSGEEMIRLCGSSWQYCNGKCNECAIAVWPSYSTVTQVIADSLDKKEFEEKYCSMCGTQRCGGITDEEFREGCPHYIEECLAKK